MNFFKEAKAYKEEQQHSEEDLRGEEEEEEEDEKREARRTTSENSKHIPFPSHSRCSGSSRTSPPLIYRNFLPRHSQEFQPPPPTPPSTRSLHFHDLMDMSPTNNNNSNNNNNNITGSVYSTTADTTNNIMVPIEKEHMFDKVVTPSDVGKLNRLVIPKQHAEKYFPFDTSSNDKGMLLNFEDRNGKPWRFRYSYWNSSQSYVMTKGWSRFVKEKKLDAGDIVTFQRGVGEEARHRLFIDWRRRPNVHPSNVHFPLFPAHLEVQNHMNVRLGNGLLYSHPHLQNFPLPPQPQFQYSNMGSSYNVHPYNSYQLNGRENLGCYYRRRSSGGFQCDDVEPMVIDSVPVVPGRTMGKTLRLFGVNVDCSMTPSGGQQVLESQLVGRPSSSTHGLVDGGSSHQLLLPSGSGSSGYGIGGIPMGNAQSHEVDKKGKTSLSFDFDV